METVSVGYGKVTYQDASASLTAFVVDEPFNRTLASKKLNKLTPTSRIPASDKPQFDGWLYQDTVNAPDNTLLLLQLSVRSYGVAVRDGAIFLRTRETAPSIIVTAHLPVSIRSSEGADRHSAFIGKADVLSISDLQDWGITPSRNYLSAFTAEDEIEECFSIERITIGAPPPRLERATTTAGSTVVFEIPRVTRRIRIRK